ncbi:MAG: hypothetical protein E6G60_01890 [Actinobacteria bacterium]|nr:MAG: hypothetical protein E6G60_01890 [Actinomycetota bacterium]
MNFIPHSRRPVEPAYTDALAETRAALASTYERLINCSSRRLPGRAVGSLCELQRATDHLQLATAAPNGRAHHDLLEALHELQEEVADLARRGGPSETILHSRGLGRAERALSRLAG